MAMKDAFLSIEDVNVIAVDWQGGSVGTTYSEGTANTQVVGA